MIFCLYDEILNKACVGVDGSGAWVIQALEAFVPWRYNKKKITCYNSTLLLRYCVVTKKKVLRNNNTRRGEVDDDCGLYRMMHAVHRWVFNFPFSTTHHWFVVASSSGLFSPFVYTTRICTIFNADCVVHSILIAYSTKAIRVWWSGGANSFGQQHRCLIIIIQSLAVIFFHHLKHPQWPSAYASIFSLLLLFKQQLAFNADGNSVDYTF